MQKFLIAIIFIFFLFSTDGFSTLCCDGTISYSSGRGTCSHHGGVCDSGFGASYSSCTKPSNPSSLDASDGDYENKIYISWRGAYNADYYKIYVKSSDSPAYSLLESYYQSTRYLYHTDKSGVQSFKVIACNSCGCSNGSIDTGYIKQVNSHDSERDKNKVRCSDLIVIDGDTLQYGGITYRLYGIDAPESYDGKKMDNDTRRCNIDEHTIENAGSLAKQFLSNLLRNIDGECEIKERYKDPYDREVALIYLPNGDSINEVLVSQGYAIAWDRYIEESDLKYRWNADEKTASQEGRGLWRLYCSLMSCLSGNIYACHAASSSSFGQTNFDQNQDIIQSIEYEILANDDGTYPITGYFAPYHFGDDPKSNWTFIFASKGDTYRLLGDTSEENIKKMGVFGWVKVDVRPNPPLFYMVHYKKDPFGWVIFNIDANSDCKNIYKLAGQDPNTKAFSYDVDGDGKTDKLNDLTCKFLGDRVKFEFKEQ